ncbi:MAG: trypsin-like peptidase domain-containing protein [Planctomycetota bacterium]
MSNPEMFVAGKLQQGQLCPCCQQAIRSGQTVGSCPICGHIQHEHCWIESGRCHAYECASPAGRAQPDLVVTAEDVARTPAPPQPPRVVPPGWSPVVSPGRRRLSVLAVVAFVCAIVGLFAFGVPGFLAIVLGSIAVGFINSRRDLKGMGFAAAAVIVGVVEIVAWAAGFCLFYLSQRDTTMPLEPPGLIRPDQVYGIDDASTIPESIRKAIRANVMIVAGGRGSMSAGSGVILANQQGRVVIITNRHVINGADGLFSGGPPAITVTFADGTQKEAKVEWRAPTGIDIALLTCPAGKSSFDTAQVASSPTLNIGESVFAVGNPLGLGWSYGKGVISAIRRNDLGEKILRIIQMQLPLNPGNSGGGLYRQDGGLIGINTFTAGRGTAAGISFSIVVSDLIPLIEEHGALKLQMTPSTPKEETRDEQQ